MSIRRTMLGLLDARTSGENVVIAIQRSYVATSEINYGDDPHLRLIKTAYSRLRSGNIVSGKNLTSDELTLQAQGLSLFPACLPEGQNSRLLALMILELERPDVWTDYPEFEAEFAGLRRSLIRKVQAGSTMLELYHRENPTMQFMDADPTGYNAMLGLFSQFESDQVDNAASDQAADPDVEQEQRDKARRLQQKRKQEQLERERRERMQREQEQQRNLVEQENRLKQLRRELDRLKKTDTREATIMLMVVIFGVPFSAFLFFQGDVKSGTAIAIILLVSVMFGSVRQLRSDKRRKKLKADLDKLSPQPDQPSWLGSLLVLTAVIFTIGYFLI